MAFAANFQRHQHTQGLVEGPDDLLPGRHFWKADQDGYLVLPPERKAATIFASFEAMTIRVATV